MAFGGIGAKPWRLETADGLRDADEIADAVLAGAAGHGANDFKIPLTRRTIRAVLRDATER
jgi:xanthine dehydrogenase YagS FAD-binding subunit